MSTVDRPAEGTVFASTSSIAAVAPVVSVEEASEIAARDYRLATEVRRLIGERDQNFALRHADGQQYVLKLIHPAEDRAVTNFQTTLLLEMERTDPSLPVQRVVRAADGRAEQPVHLRDGTERMMRLTTFLPGQIVRGLPRDHRRSRSLGQMLARIQLALVDLSHPADSHEIAWDVRHTARQRVVLNEVGTPDQRADMAEGLARFAARAQPAQDWMRRQVVHNDLSGDNAVVDPAAPEHVAGVLDFGDATRTAVANDVAIAAAYNTFDDDDLLGGALALVKGFHAAKPLLPEEVDLLPDLIIARMVIRVGITEWRAKRFPDNTGYILRNTPEAWRVLRRLLRADPARMRAAFHQACETE